MKVDASSPEPDGAHAERVEWPGSRLARVLILLALLVVPQAILFGPSLVGARVLLPLDILQQYGIYSPPSMTQGAPRPKDPVLADLVYELEPQRVYAVEAVRSGRIPLWNPLIYCGTPFVAANHTSVFYPLRALDYLFPGTAVIAWVQLVKSVLAGIGAYLFARRVLRVSYWPAAIGAALWPLTGFLVLWAGFTISQVGAHLPWLLLATDETLRKPRSRWPIALALVTAVLLVSGHASVAAHALIAAGLFALFRVGDLHGWRGFTRRAGLGALLAVVLGWSGGVLLSAPQTFTTLDYMKESWRIERRQAGRVETSSMGLAALPAIVMPYYWGSTQSHTLMLVNSNRPEGPQAAYSGLLALLVLAPLGFASGRLRRFQFFWILLGFLGLTQVLGVPGLERVFELPVLNTLRNNRFTLVTAWSGVALAMIGLEALVRGEVRWQKWMWIPVALIAGVALYAAAGAATTPEFLQRAAEGQRLGTARGPKPIDTAEGLESVRAWFRNVRLGYALLACFGLGAWFALRASWSRSRAFAIALGLAALVESTTQAFDVNVQCDPALYYPRAKLYDDLRQLPRARVCGGFGTLPASLLQTQGLADVRGYDAADPARLIELLSLFKGERAPAPYDYAAVQFWLPKLPSPLADLLGLRYLVTVGREPPRHVLGDGGLWVQEVPTALPRAFVPAQVQVANDKAARLALLARDDFDPRRVVYIESSSADDFRTSKSATLDARAAAAGSARIVVDEPERVELELDIQSGGVVVLADRWASGWKARVDGDERAVLIADHALRAVAVAPGERRLEFRYEPASWRAGWIAAALAACACVAWFVLARRWSVSAR